MDFAQNVKYEPGHPEDQQAFVDARNRLRSQDQTLECKRCHSDVLKPSADFSRRADAGRFRSLVVEEGVVKPTGNAVSVMELNPQCSQADGPKWFSPTPNAKLSRRRGRSHTYLGLESSPRRVRTREA